MRPAGPGWISEARLLAEVTRASAGGPIFIIGGPREARLTIYSQQCRAINLACALREREGELKDRDVAVIGAGAAGMTAASALIALGLPQSRLTIYERAASPLYTQRWSYGRFLHPRLFHWPEEGWRDGRAGLPLADWGAGYAAAVREQILSRCAALSIQFCTDVQAVESLGSRARVTYRRLHSPWSKHGDFDLVLVASGFPVEPKVAHTIGGTYWHGLDGLDEMIGDVHLVGDGDGALTEVLMMLIDRFGHAAVERLCDRLPLRHLDKLNEEDLEAQGDPSQPADIPAQYIQSIPIRTLFYFLRGVRRRSVFIHAKNPLGGSSFLLNRALVSHLTWGSRPMVQLRPGAKIDPLEVQGMGNVIWRAGVGSLPLGSYAQARITTKGLIASLQPNKAIGPIEAGLLTGLLDGLRRPMWTEPARRTLAAKVRSSGAGWTEPKVGAFSPVAGRPSIEAEELLGVIAATAGQLECLGLPGLDTVRLGDTRWVSIDVLARTGSCSHTDLVTPHPPKLMLRWVLTEPRQTPAKATLLRCDRQHRLWFQVPSDPAGVEPTRSAVSALVEPSALHEWARRGYGGGFARRRLGGSTREVSKHVLRGLGDVAGADVRTKLLLARMHEARDEWQETRSAYLRAARQPAGKHRGAFGARERTSPHLSGAFRRVLLGLGGAIARMRPGEPEAVEHAVWLALAAAGGNLVTVASSDDLTLELVTTPNFLRRTWAPRVRSVLALDGRSSRAARVARPPDWAASLADVALALGHAGPEEVQSMLDSVGGLADTCAGYAEQETPNEPLITLSELGVWVAGTEMDLELRNGFRGVQGAPSREA